MAKALEMLLHGARVMRNKPQGAQTEFATRQNLSLEFPFPKENALANVHFSARPNQRFPSRGIDLSSQKYLDFPGQMLGTGSPRRTLRMETHASAKQTSRNHSRIVKNKELVATQKLREFLEESILDGAGTPIQSEHARCLAPIQGALGYAVFRKRVVELIQMHEKRQSTSNSRKSKEGEQIETPDKPHKLIERV